MLLLDLQIERDMRLLGHCLSLLLRLYCVLFLIFEIAAAAAALFVLVRRKYLSFFLSGAGRHFVVFRFLSSRESDDCTRSEIYYGAAIVPQATVPLASPSLFPNALFSGSCISMAKCLARCSTVLSFLRPTSISL